MTTEAEAAIWKDVGIWVLDDFRVWIEAIIEARIGRQLAPPPDVRPTDVPVAHRITRANPDRELHLVGWTTSSRTKPSRDHVKGGPHDALYLALKERWIAGAGLDDIEEEPAKQRTGSRPTRSSAWTTWSSRHMRRTTPKRRSERSATLPHMRCHGC